MSSPRKEPSQPTHTAHRTHKATDHVKAAGLAGLIETVFFHPVDTMTKRLQKKVGPLRAEGEAFMAAFKKVALGSAANKPLLQQWGSLYPGLHWAMTYKVMQRAYKLGSQPVLQQFLQDHYSEEFRHLFGDNGKTMMHALAGGALGAGEVIFLPIDAMKIKYQTNRASYQGLSILAIARAENLYKGISFTVCRNIIGSSVLFAAPYVLKTSVLGLDQHEKLTNVQSAALSLAASTCSIVSSSPPDVIKTRIQSEKTKISGVNMAFTMFTQEGPLSFFKGAGMKVLLQGPKLAFALFLTNYIAEALSNHRQRKQDANQESANPRNRM